MTTPPRTTDTRKDFLRGHRRRNRTFRTQWLEALDGVRLPPTDRLVALALGSFMNGEGVCFPGRPRLAARAGRAESTVWAAIKRLELADWIVVTVAKGGGSGHKTEYAAWIPEEPVGYESTGLGVSRQPGTCRFGGPNLSISSVEGDRKPVGNRAQERPRSRTLSSTKYPVPSPLDAEDGDGGEQEKAEVRSLMRKAASQEEAVAILRDYQERRAAAEEEAWRARVRQQLEESKVPG